MKTMKLFKQQDNKSVGIFQVEAGEFLALTFTQSKTFKSIKGATNWMAKRGHK